MSENIVWNKNYEINTFYVKKFIWNSPHAPTFNENGWMLPDNKSFDVGSFTVTSFLNYSQLQLSIAVTLDSSPAGETIFWIWFHKLTWHNSSNTFYRFGRSYKAFS